MSALLIVFAMGAIMNVWRSFAFFAGRDVGRGLDCATLSLLFAACALNAGSAP